MLHLFAHDKQVDFMYAMSRSLIHHGIESRVHTTVPRELKDELWLGIWHRCFDLPNRYIAYNTEAVRTEKWTRESPRFLDRALEVWDYTVSNLPVLESRGYEAVHVPLAYSEYYEESFPGHKEKDVDVLFYGAVTERRAKVIQQLRLRGLEVKWLGENRDFNYGDARNNWIARSKMVVSICSHDPGEFLTNDLSRVMPLVANKIPVVSELVGDQAVEDIWKQHVCLCRYEDLASSCWAHILDEEGRDETAEAAYQFAVDHYNLKDMIPIERLRRHM